MGGIPGRSPPPSPRLASLYRRLTSMTASSTLSTEFSVSLEGTHHGPWLTTPSLFAEIGSVPEHWERRDVADLWAEVLFIELGLGGDEIADAGRVNPGSCWWHGRVDCAHTLSHPLCLVSSEAQAAGGCLRSSAPISGLSCLQKA